MLGLLAVAVYGLALVAAAASDLTHYEIPNGISIALAAGFTLLVPGLQASEAAWHLAAGGAVFIVTAALFARGIMGGGDVKLLSATALWTGFAGLPAFMLLMALFGAALAAALLTAKRLVPEAAFGRRWYAHLLAREAGVPYGVAIAGAGLALLPQLSVMAGARQQLAQIFAPALGG